MSPSFRRPPLHCQAITAGKVVESDGLESLGCKCFAGVAADIACATGDKNFHVVVITPRAVFATISIRGVVSTGRDKQIF